MAETATVEATENNSEVASSQVAAEETGKTLVTETAGEQATEQNQDGKKPTEAAKTADEAKPGAPEKYEFADADKYDATVLATFSEAAKAANLTQEAAQELLAKVAPSLQARTSEQIEAVKKGWVEASTNDKEFGGEKLKENLAVARKALDTFASPEFKTFLDDSGLGSHPEMIRLLYRAGKAISEDSFVAGAASGKSEVNPTSVLYDNTRKE